MQLQYSHTTTGKMPDIYRLDSIIEAYYETFIPSIATDGISMDMYYTYKVAMKDIDINKVAKTTNFSMSFPSDIDFNKLKEQKEDFYTNEILINIKKRFLIHIS
ncbi:hypothetical protein KZ344_03520 [Glaesserella parasuis]|nr:hypothetical protein [Glaesserella parasuis]MCT8763366.1 hypothetical protein [Glaesserella parasuis]MCT8779378.1 hypothetical protein [Glaesserella parasuis]